MAVRRPALRAELEELTGKPVLLSMLGSLARRRGRGTQGPGVGAEDRRRRLSGDGAVPVAAAGPACRLDHGGPAVVKCGLCPMFPMCPAMRLP